MIPRTNVAGPMIEPATVHMPGGRASDQATGPEIMCETLADYEDSFSIGDRLINNFQFADDIIVNAEQEEAGVLVDHLNTTITM